jgi:hypothetical protein
MCFRLSIWPNGHRESQKYELVNGISRTNEATGLNVVSPNSAQKSTWFRLALLEEYELARGTSLQKNRVSALIILHFYMSELVRLLLGSLLKQLLQ